MIRAVLRSFVVVAVMAGPAFAQSPTSKPAVVHKHKAKHKMRAARHRKHHRHHAKRKHVEQR